jgi:hypothetical protein
MSTPSKIWIRIKKEDFGKTMIANPSMLPNQLKENNYPCEEFQIPSEPKNGILYLGVYCNFDGYFNGVGQELKTKFNSYETALNLILLGALSYIIDDVVSYHNWRNEELNIEILEGESPTSDTEYTYVFKNNKWYSRHIQF